MSPEEQTEKRVRILAAAAMAFSVFLSFRLWATDRTFPLAPMVDWLPSIPPRFGYAGTLLLLILLAVISFVKSPKHYLAALVGLLVILIVLDQSRLQAWVYFWGFVFLALTVFHYRPASRPSVLQVLRLLLCVMYFWSGIHKLNHQFVTYGLPWIVGSDDAVVKAFALPVAAYEAAIGVLLLFPRTRKVGLYSAVALHAIILIVLGPLGRNYNSVVWPWNLALIGTVFILFRDDTPPRSILTPKTALHWATIVVMGIIPALGLLHVLDPPLSFKLYSGNVSRMYIQPPPEERARYESYITPEGDISVQNWSMGELNVFFYPSERVYWKIFEDVASRSPSPGNARLIIVGEPDLFTGERTLRHFRLSGEEVPCENCAHGKQ